MLLKSKTPLTWNVAAVVFAFTGGFVTIFAFALLGGVTEYLFLIAPFGASCVLAFAVWEAPLAQPRNIIGGHLVASFCALLVLQLFGNHPWSVALGVGLAMACMVLTKTTHPPAGADPVIIITGNCAWSFLLFPVASGAVLLTLIAVLLNRFAFRRGYPKFWY